MSASTTPALAALRAFTDANARGDGPAMTALLSRSTLANGGFSGPTQGDFRYVFGEAEWEGESVVIPLEARAADAAPEDPPMMAMRCVMVREDGAWKFDLAATMRPIEEAMDAALRDAAAQIGPVMSGAMEAVGDALAEALRSEFTGEELAPSAWEDAPGEVEADDLRPLPALVPLEGASAQVARVTGRAIPVLADVTGILALFNTDDAGPLMPWLNDEFCGGLGEAIAAGGDHAGLLRGVRIEPATDWNEHFLVLEGDILVYRADFRSDHGWYRTREDLLRIIPGVVAGLAGGPPDVPAGFTALPTNDTGPTVTRYREAWAPRLMRRISVAAGGPVALDADWGSFFDEASHGRGLALWGLVRVPGALALHAARGGPMPRAVRLRSGTHWRRASCAGGVLELELVVRDGPRGNCYEHEIAEVLAGATIEGDDVQPAERS